MVLLRSGRDTSKEVKENETKKQKKITTNYDNITLHNYKFNNSDCIYKFNKKFNKNCIFKHYEYPLCKSNYVNRDYRNYDNIYIKDCLKNNKICNRLSFIPIPTKKQANETENLYKDAIKGFVYFKFMKPVSTLRSVMKYLKRAYKSSAGIKEWAKYYNINYIDADKLNNDFHKYLETISINKKERFVISNY